MELKTAVDTLQVFADYANRSMYDAKFAQASKYYLLAATRAGQRFEYAREKALLRLAWICEERACGRPVEEPWG